MPRKRDLMGSGFSAGQANGVNTVGSVTAAGNASVSAATLLSYAVNYVRSGSVTNSVILPNADQGIQPGDVVYVFTADSTTVNVYIGSGDTANGSGSLISLAQNKMLILTRMTNTAWAYIATA